MSKKFFQIYKECIKVSFATASTYRVNFFLSNLITLVSNILFPLVTILIYSSGSSFHDWSLYEVLLIQSIFTISSGISSMLFDGLLWATMRHVLDGSLEIVLIKPVDCLFYLIASTFGLESLGLLLGGVVMFIVSIIHLGSFTLIMRLQCILLFISGILVMMGISLIMAATSFKWVGNSRIPEIFNSIKSFGKYPQSIFQKAISGFTTFIMPVAMVGYFPAAVLLGRGEVYMFAAIVPCALFAMAGIGLYKHMIHLYEGVGG